MRYISLGALVLALAGLTAGCERGAYMAPVVEPRVGEYGEYGEYERRPYYRAPGYRPFFGEREFGD